MSRIKKRIDKCIRVLQNSKSSDERKAAVKELLKIGLGAEEALPELMKIINGREEFTIQGLAEETVIKIGEPSIAYIKRLLKSLKWKKRSKAIEILGAIALTDKETITKVLSLILPIATRDLNYHVRLDVVTIVGKLLIKSKKQTHAIEILGEVLRTDRHMQIQKEVSNLLSSIDSDLAIKELVKSVKRENYPLIRPTGNPRVEAANGLYLVAHDKPKKLKFAIPDLLKVLRKDPTPAVRASVLLPLALSGGWDVVEDIIDSAACDRWYQVRVTALTVIGIIINQKPTKRKLKSIEPLIKKIARDDKYEYVQNSARDLLEVIDEKIKTE
ncbi:MAG: HEAT repeat domain-containing protein [Asgard group archaeon]|nr:HEAT repeat domain-containing protein [Asgard group archaeon]